MGAAGIVGLAIAVGSKSAKASGVFPHRVGDSGNATGPRIRPHHGDHTGVSPMAQPVANCQILQGFIVLSAGRGQNEPARKAPLRPEMDLGFPGSRAKKCTDQRAKKSNDQIDRAGLRTGVAPIGGEGTWGLSEAFRRDILHPASGDGPMRPPLSARAP